MTKFLKLLFKYTFLLLIGGLVYGIVEILYRGYTHWTMVLVGGVCFCLCGLVNEILYWEDPLWLQMLKCTFIITIVEFLAGSILNIWLKLSIWDYSNIPFNILGQICIPFMIIWFFLSAPAIILDDYIRYLFFKEEKPRYYWK